MTDPADVDEGAFDAVEQIPPGRVTTYGAIGRLIGIGPRRVARALSQGGGAVLWWRVLRADGTVAEPVRARQRRSCWPVRASPHATGGSTSPPSAGPTDHHSSTGR